MREATDDSAAASTTSAQPTRPEGRRLPVGTESDPTISYPTTRVNHLIRSQQELHPEIIDIQSGDGRLQQLFAEVPCQSSSKWNQQSTFSSLGTYNQQPYLSDSEPIYTQSPVDQQYLTSSESNYNGQWVNQHNPLFDYYSDTNIENELMSNCIDIDTNSLPQHVSDTINQHTNLPRYIFPQQPQLREKPLSTQTSLFVSKM